MLLWGPKLHKEPSLCRVQWAVELQLLMTNSFSGQKYVKTSAYNFHIQGAYEGMLFPP